MKIDRHSAIRDQLYRNGEMGIGALAAAIEASPATIRRDLQALEKSGLITRTHGGARIAETSTRELAFKVRETQNLRAKRMIAAAAMRLIEPNSSIFLDSGTTVLQVVRLLRLTPKPLTVFTNGLMVALDLMNVPELNVGILGGQLRDGNASSVGPFAETMLGSIWFDVLLLGVGAIAPDGRIHSVDIGEASLNARMLQRATKIVILADATKFGRTATFAVAPIPAGSIVVTDRLPTPEWRERLRDAGAELVVASDSGAATGT